MRYVPKLNHAAGSGTNLEPVGVAVNYPRMKSCHPKQGARIKRIRTLKKSHERMRPLLSPNVVVVNLPNDRRSFWEGARDPENARHNNRISASVTYEPRIVALARQSDRKGKAENRTPWEPPRFSGGSNPFKQLRAPPILAVR